MLIATLQNLDQETAAEICSQAGDDNDSFERLLNNLHNGVEVAVLCCEVDNVEPRSSYYDIAFVDGTIARAVSGYHLRGIINWK